jgi:hypothetical protein
VEPGHEARFGQLRHASGRRPWMPAISGPAQWGQMILAGLKRAPRGVIDSVAAILCSAKKG